MKNQIITVQDTQIHITDDDFINLRDIAGHSNREPDDVIKNWMRAKNTIILLGAWEAKFNPNFNSVEFDGIKSEAGTNAFTLSPKRWIEQTNAIGIRAKGGRYSTGTFAHKDIAFAFCYWLSPDFQLYVSWEFQRLKQLESSDWQLRRELAKLNYPLQTEAVRTMIEEKRQIGALRTSEAPIYAAEADVLNMAVFGMTAEQWRTMRPDARGNLRDHASIIELHVLANMESYNAILIRNGWNQWQRINELTRTAAEQMRIFEETNIAAIQRLRRQAEPSDGGEVLEKTTLPPNPSATQNVPLLG